MSEWSAAIHSLIPMGQIGRVLTVFRQREDGGVSVVGPLTLTDIPYGGSYQAEIATMIKSHGLYAGAGRDEITDFLQCMMNLAWKEGLRPNGFESPTQELKAVRDHLADMRKLAKVPNA